MKYLLKKIENIKVQFNAGKYQEALEEVNKIKTKNSDINFQLKELEAAIYIKKQQPKLALEIISGAEYKYSKETANSINIKGIAHRALGNHRLAIEILQNGITKYTNSVDLAHNLSVTAADIGNFELAESSGINALKINPNYIETYKNLGRVYIASRNTKKAIEIFSKLNNIDNDSVDVLVGLGAAELLQSKPETAAPYFEKALSKNTELSAAWANLGVCKKYLGDYEGAKICLETAINKDPKQIEHKWNLSLINLALGNFKEGWKQYEVRYDPTRISPDAVKLPNTKIPMLSNGDSIYGKIIILVQEQGYGDTFQFFRLSKLLKEEGAKKIIAIVSRELKEIIRTIPWIDEIKTELRETKEVPDYWTFSMSLPARYKFNRPQDIPKIESYLSVDVNKKNYWSKYLSSIDGNKKFRVGIVWAGRESHSNDSNRSIKFETFEPIFSMDQNIQFISLQKGRREEDARSNKKVIPMGHYLNDFSDTAAILSNLDLLISVDSSPIHLAGAIGMPVWALIPEFFDFRWMINRTDSPWYPSMILHRQGRKENWQDVIEKMKHQLEETLKNHNKRWEPKELYINHPSIDEETDAGCSLFLKSAFKFHMDGNLDFAEAMYKKFIAYSKNPIDGIRNLASLYRSKGELSLAMKVYLEGEKLNPLDSIFYTNFANLLIDMKKYSEAIEKANIALSIKPDHEPAKAIINKCLSLNYNE